VHQIFAKNKEQKKAERHVSNEEGVGDFDLFPYHCSNYGEKKSLFVVCVRFFS